MIITHEITPAKPAGIQVNQRITLTHPTREELGKKFEIDFFGSRYNHTDEQRIGIKLAGSYYFMDNCREVVRNQNNIIPTGWDPKNPSTPMSQRLSGLIRVAMTPKTRDGFELDCTLGSVLDYSFGTDGLFSYVYKGELIKSISFDLALRGGPKKLEEMKAHVLVTRRMFEDEDPTTLNLLATLTAKTLNNRKIKTPGAMFDVFKEFNKLVLY